jgi:POT family proton-dependent oligopeptide transporter
MIALLRQHPRAFYVIFMLEIWERFGFYTVQGILVLYFVRVSGLTYEDAYYAFGAFSALTYGMVALGGYLGDHVLGPKSTLVLGLIVLASGYLALALVDKPYIFHALGLVCIGGGLFKANPPNLLAKAYGVDDARLHSAFTLYYMSVNLGAVAALFVGPFLARHYGYSCAYFASFIGIMLSLTSFCVQRQYLAYIHTPLDEEPKRFWIWLGLGVAIFSAMYLCAYLLQHVLLTRHLLSAVTVWVLFVYGLYMKRESKVAQKRMFLALILMIEAVIFFTLYQQMPMSLNVFAVNNVHARLFAITVDPQSFQALNAFWIIFLSPVVGALYLQLNQRNIAFHLPYKFALGMTSCGLGFLSLYFCRFLHDEQGMVSAGWLVLAYFFQSLGELLVSALGVAMVAELVPQKMTGFVMGAWFLTSAVAGFTGAFVASLTALPSQVLPGVPSLMLYTHVFGCIGGVTIIASLLLWIAAPFLCRLGAGQNERFIQV